MVLVHLQAKERQKRKGGTKGIRIGADGDASLEDLTNSEFVGDDALEPEKAKLSNKKVIIFPLSSESNICF